METIRAADNLAIELDDGMWRLVTSMPAYRLLLTVDQDSGDLVYIPVFAQARHLPVMGRLPATDIGEVVVGWSQGDQAWHLGLLLGPDAARVRGGRWCELARWSDNEATATCDQARQAGAALAALLHISFRFVQAAGSQTIVRPDTPGSAARWKQEVVPHLRGMQDRLMNNQAAPVLAPPPAQVYTRDTAAGLEDDPSQVFVDVALPEDVAVDEHPTPVVRVRRADEGSIDLPIDLGEWRLKPIEVGLQWEHTRVWSLGTIWGVFYRIALGIVFIFVSALTLQSAYAPVHPAVLPYFGIAIGLGLILAGFRLTTMMLRARSFVVDTTLREVRQHLDLTSDVREVYHFDEIRAVVVTQFAQQKQRGQNGEPDRMTHEAWLHLLLHEARQEPGKERKLRPDDAYVLLGHIELTEGEIVPAHFEGKKSSRLPQKLYPEEATSPVQKAGLVLARAMQVDAFIDQR